MPHQGSSLHGRVVLIVQRWIIASALATPFEANGARVLLAAGSRVGLALADHPDLSAGVVDTGSRELCRRLEARGIPFLFYTGRDRINDEFATAPIIRKPAPPGDVVEGVRQLLT
jgi:hypothetical protein